MMFLDLSPLVGVEYFRNGLLVLLAASAFLAAAIVIWRGLQLVLDLTDDE